MRGNFHVFQGPAGQEYVFDDGCPVDWRYSGIISSVELGQKDDNL